MYHKTIVKTEDELATIKKERDEKRKLKEARQKMQAQNALSKTQMKEDSKRKSIADAKDKDEKTVDEHSDDDDAAYYKEELGEEPDEGMQFQYICTLTFAPENV